ncbi:fluoride efflux transporter CrcB [Roseovarius aestuariivivens]|uniref:fluoride efflux transporter CrcB n=1 Tax=Roseovarius aestuariivivens TaxID=1888910 RepID=UPI001080AA49|nr:fluoride efflux transporter CrcB [Roseovarius aestuariivivens]
MFATLLQVGLGGAIGALLRFGAGVGLTRLVGGGFPLAVLPVNVLGSFVMGVLFIWSLEKEMTHLNPFLLTGILGGFTTFSAFSLEAFLLWEDGLPGQALAYVALSVVLSIAGLALGVWLARGAFA